MRAQNITSQLPIRFPIIFQPYEIDFEIATYFLKRLERENLFTEKYESFQESEDLITSKLDIENSNKETQNIIILKQ